MEEESKIVYKWKRYFVERVKKKLGQKFFEVIVFHFPKTVGILPLIEENKIVLVRQYRFPAKKSLREIPAGKLEEREKPIEGAKRELLEETGYFTKNLKKMAEFFVSPGYSTEYMYLFLAKNLKKRKQNFSEDEKIEKVKIFSLKEILEMIEEKKIVDEKTILAILLYKLKILNGKRK